MKPYIIPIEIDNSCPDDCELFEPELVRGNVLFIDNVPELVTPKEKVILCSNRDFCSKLLKEKGDKE